MYTLMNAAKQASIYTPGVAGGYSVMIVPVAMLDHQRFETDEKMVYSVSGMKANDGMYAARLVEIAVLGPKRLLAC